MGAVDKIRKRRFDWQIGRLLMQALIPKMDIHDLTPALFSSSTCIDEVVHSLLAP
jgi:hypothetical protein